MKNLHNLISEALQLHEKGKFQDAISLYSKILENQKNDPQLLFLLGTAYVQIGKIEQGIVKLKKSIFIKPENVFAHSNLGNALKDLKHYEDALASYNKAITINPNYAEIHNNKGNALKGLKRYEEALASYNKAITINPDYAFAYNNQGIILQDLKRYDEALASYDKAIKINPDYVDIYNNKGNVLKDLKRYDEALACYEKVIESKSDFDYIVGKVLNANMFLCKWNDFDSMIEKINNTINKKSKVIEPFTLLGVLDNPDFLKLSTECYVKDNFPKFTENQTLARYINHKKPRIGYFSADFHNHATLHLMMDVFKNHNKSLFDFYGFSYGPEVNDSWNKEVKNYFNKFEDVSKISDKEAAYLSRSLEIDIAIDLKGLTSNSRSGIFSFRAAPIQINYLGYPGTMGAEYMDYIIADEVIIPKENFNYYTEKVLHLPGSYQPNMKKRNISKKEFKRSDFELPKDGFVFCSFNNNYKITPYIFDTWMNMLKKVPNSVLWIFKTNETASNNLEKEAKTRGVNPKRIIFASYLPAEEHLKRISFADLFLDTFPCNAHTTASDAVRMGVPVITLIGNTFASRVAASILSCLNMEELITSNKTEYEKLGIELATNNKKFATIKNSLKVSVSKSPLFDSFKFTKNLENLYLQILK